MAENNVEFITIELNKKRCIVDEKYKNDAGKQFAKVYAPEGGSFLYPADKLRIDDKKPDKVYFSLPKGTEMQVSYKVGEDYEPRTILIEDLKEMYAAESKSYSESHGFYNMSVPTEWGREFESKDGEKLISIAVPTDYEDKKVYMNFVIKADSFKPSEKEEGMSYFGFPKHKMENGETSENEYEVNLRGSLPLGNNEYKDIQKTVTSKELLDIVDRAKKTSSYKDTFVTAVISEKLVKAFTGKQGNELYSVSVPTHDESMENVTWYKIVLPADRVKHTEDNKVQLSLFRRGSDGNPYTFKATRSVKDENGEYVDVDIQLTSEDVVKAFEDSKNQYASESHSHTLADEQNGQQQTPPRHGRGR